MKKLIVILMNLLVLPAFSSNILYTDGSVEYLGLQGNGLHRYRIKVIQIRDAVNSFDDFITVGIYDKGTNGSIQYVIQVPTRNDQTYYRDAIHGIDIRMRVYYNEVNLPASTVGYTFFSGLCCLRYFNNIENDQGTELRISTPDQSKLKPGDISFRFSEYPPIFLHSDSTYTFTFPHWNNYFDSIRIVSDEFYVFGDVHDPVPSPPDKLPSRNPGTYKSGYSKSNPLGTKGTYVQLNDSQYQLHFTNPGIFYFPLSMLGYENGQVTQFDCGLPIILFDSINPSLCLNTDQIDSKVFTFTSNSSNWASNVQINLERSTSNGFKSISAPLQNITHGNGVQLVDSVLSRDSSFYYRLRAVNNQDTFYSNVVFIPGLSNGLFEVYESSIQVYPNPTQGKLIIKDEKQGEYRIYTMQGKLVLKGMKLADEAEIDVHALSAGTYIFLFQGQNQRIQINR
ncbi:MAG: T9SS type A sorting domain-containing protein [Bacteroidetes bacterium]|nr:T9SS type A sorting domain-containing protein [Bacteroidota bacterium]